MRAVGFVTLWASSSSGVVRPVARLCQLQSSGPKTSIEDIAHNLEDIKMSAEKLHDKMLACHELGLWEPEQTQGGDHMNHHRVSSAVSRTTMATRVKISVWHNWLWKLQARFGSTTASVFRDEYFGHLI